MSIRVSQGKVVHDDFLNSHKMLKRIKKCIILVFCFNNALLINGVSLNNMTLFVETHPFNTEKVRIMPNKIFSGGKNIFKNAQN